MRSQKLSCYLWQFQSENLAPAALTDLKDLCLNKFEQSIHEFKYINDAGKMEYTMFSLFSQI